MAKQTLTVQLMHANARIAELEAKLAEAHDRALRTAVKALPQPRAAWSRPAHMEAARQLAMSTGCCVKV